MKEQEIAALVQRQRDFFATGETLKVDFRIRQLKKLRDAVNQNQEKIQAALKEDLGKSGFEGFMCETGLVLSEISCQLRHIRRFAYKPNGHNQGQAHPHTLPCTFLCVHIFGG